MTEPFTFDEVKLLTPKIFADERGEFVETFRANLQAHTFVQDNLSQSGPHVLRGLHYRIGEPEGKLVQCVAGVVFDVVVDIRRSSPTFGRWYGTRLSAANHHQLWIPPGFAHGFYAIIPATLMYKVTGYYEPRAERSILWSDPQLGIQWPGGYAPILSPKDASAPSFADSELLP